MENLGETVENLGRKGSKSKEKLVRTQGEPGKILERTQTEKPGETLKRTLREHNSNLGKT